jgi:hypothetical protein
MESFDAASSAFGSPGDPVPAAMMVAMASGASVVIRSGVKSIFLPAEQLADHGEAIEQDRDGPSQRRRTRARPRRFRLRLQCR